MIFQIIDDKKDCTGWFASGQLRQGSLPKNMTATWDWSPRLGDERVSIAKIYAQGKQLSSVCPDHLATRWAVHESKIKSHIKSFVSARVNMGDICFYDLVPQQHIKHYYQTLNDITEWVIENYDRPQNYSFLHELTVTCREIAQQEVKIDWPLLKKFANKDQKAMYLAKACWDRKNVVNYNVFGTKTGRLGLLEGSFPILNLKKEIRSCVLPQNDLFVELDFNGAELRTLLHLSGHPQPQEDIHDWNQRNIFSGDITRDDAKTQIFAWLYNPTSKKIESDYYDKTRVLHEYYRDGFVTTPFRRTMASDDFHALNYLIQSTSSDNFLTNANKIHRYLRGMRSNVAFMVHDSLVIDLHKNDKRELSNIIRLFQDTKLGHFKTNVKIGKNLGKMESVEW
jgi:hypothetical protein